MLFLISGALAEKNKYTAVGLTGKAAGQLSGHLDALGNNHSTVGVIWL